MKSRPPVRRNVAPAIIEGALLLLPYVIKSVTSVAQTSLARFNRLPRAERVAFVQATLLRKTWFAASPLVWAAAQQAAKSPAVVDQLVDLMSTHGDTAVVAAGDIGGAAAGVTARRYAAPAAPATRINPQVLSSDERVALRAWHRTEDTDLWERADAYLLQRGVDPLRWTVTPTGSVRPRKIARTQRRR